MLDLQAQPRTGGVTRGAPDKGDVGSDSPLGREAGPRSVPPPLPPPPTLKKERRSERREVLIEHLLCTRAIPICIPFHSHSSPCRV